MTPRRFAPLSSYPLARALPPCRAMIQSGCPMWIDGTNTMAGCPFLSAFSAGRAPFVSASYHAISSRFISLKFARSSPRAAECREFGESLDARLIPGSRSPRSSSFALTRAAAVPRPLACTATTVFFSACSALAFALFGSSAAQRPAPLLRARPRIALVSVRTALSGSPSIRAAIGVVRASRPLRQTSLSACRAFHPPRQATAAH